MNYRQIAALIPESYRTEMLQTNMISNAISTAGDPSMFYLFTIWKNYVEPSGNLNLECSACLANILHNYREMQQTFIEMELERKLLASLVDDFEGSQQLANNAIKPRVFADNEKL